MMSSLMPSEKYSCSGSPLMLAKGSTQTESRGGEICSWRSIVCTANARTGRSRFFTVCSPKSSNVHDIFPATWSRTVSETATPPIGASVCSRAATLTPSP